MRILFIGESWLGSTARSWRDALSRQRGVRIEEISEDLLFPYVRLLSVRVTLRLLRSKVQAAFRGAIFEKIRQFRPQYVVCFKGAKVTRELVHEIQETGCRVINIFPDYSPLNQGDQLKEALGHYDLVVSTKNWHPSAWSSQFEYTNRCEFVPHGFDAMLHLRDQREVPIVSDVVLVASYRPEYGRLISGLAQQRQLENTCVRVYGNGWIGRDVGWPRSWMALSAVTGQAYVDVLQSGKICLAPVTRDVVVDGVRFPGDEDTTRTYEIPACGAFSIHKRTTYVKEKFEEGREIVLYDDEEDLAREILEYLQDDNKREAIARAAHQRVISRDSIDQRSNQLLEILGSVK